MAVPILWRNRRQRYNLQGDRCPACERAVFPPREICPYCSRDKAAGRAEGSQEPAVNGAGALFAMPHLQVDAHRLQAGDSLDPRNGSALRDSARHIVAPGEDTEMTRHKEHYFVWTNRVSAELQEAGDD